ncbi:unnamed protein product [Acanthoscelides obtectus]|uniref:Uncharacterized protein n=1 Tax=Acanthoscelides obtectus TaxID=200917 RepID=A0A9P0Q9Z6_ACAOB|nr:unnamed protein product [Acanthoscelides obtectus]CAK1624204.1 hypothetical protein AOBTE_LOCUS2399 [Acanthoscelides obtectus]
MKKVVPAVLEAASLGAFNKYINLTAANSPTTDAGAKKNKGTGLKENKPAHASSNIIKGSSKDNSFISAAEDCRTYYVGNVSTKSSEKLKQFLMEHNIPVIACDQTVSNKEATSTGLSYKISVKPVCREHF